MPLFKFSTTILYTTITLATASPDPTCSASNQNCSCESSKQNKIIIQDEQNIETSLKRYAVNGKSYTFEEYTDYHKNYYSDDQINSHWQDAPKDPLPFCSSDGNHTNNKARRDDTNARCVCGMQKYVYNPGHVIPVDGEHNGNYSWVFAGHEENPNVTCQLFQSDDSGAFGLARENWWAVYEDDVTYCLFWILLKLKICFHRQILIVNKLKFSCAI